MANPIGKRAVTKIELTLRQSHNRGNNPVTLSQRNFSVSAAGVAGALFSHTAFCVSESPESYQKLVNLSGYF